MPTYSGNAYNILTDVRYGINEFSTALVQGTDTTGAFQNAELMRQINNAQNYLWSVLKDALPDIFLTSASITFTSSVASLPGDCWKIREVLDSDGYPVDPINMGQKHIDSDSGSSNSYYRYGNSLRIDADGVTGTGTLWYYSRCRELDTGMCVTVANTLATTAKAIADYYNNMLIENFTQSTVGTITDYTAARLATISTNFLVANDYYGIVSDLPEIFQPLISEYAILQLKKNPKVPLQVSNADIALFGEMLAQTLRTFAGTQHGDVYINDVINDFESM